MHVLPDGDVFCATPIEIQIPRSFRYHPDTGAVTPVALLADRDYQAPKIAASIDTASVLLPLTLANRNRPSVLLCGGSTPLRIDLADEHPTWRPAGQRKLQGPRFNLNAVILPTGEIFVSGGVADKTHDRTAVRVAEMYHADTDTWEALEAASVVRNYHSVALLMPDGAVWTAGSNRNGMPSDPQNDTRELAIEIYRPWYFDRDRPVLVAAPEGITYSPDGGDTFPVTVDFGTAHRIRRVVLIRTASTTHGFSSDQRYVELEFRVSDSDDLLVTPPRSGGIAPPGVYLIHVVDDAGVPSMGTFIALA
jgi:hypothetical protein